MRNMKSQERKYPYTREIQAELEHSSTSLFLFKLSEFANAKLTAETHSHKRRNHGACV
jgi:hypothetical protein